MIEFNENLTRTKSYNTENNGCTFCVCVFLNKRLKPIKLTAVNYLFKISYFIWYHKSESRISTINLCAVCAEK